jgi:hypothetical protein
LPIAISVYQQGETGNAPAEAIAISSAANGTLRLHVTPKLLGPVQFGFRVEYADGTVAARMLRIFVAPPATQPLAFSANDLPVLVLTRDSDTASAMPHPSAIYPAPVGQVDLNARFVRWQAAPQQGTQVIRVARNGWIEALRPGEAEVAAHFGTATARLRVIVRATQQ